MANQKKTQLDKFGIAAVLQEIAALMELKGGKYRFKAKAYNAGARSIQGVSNLDQLVAEDRLTSLPRIGDALASQIKQLYLTGESSVLNELKREFPIGIAELSKVPGLSVPKIKQLQDELSITSIDELKAAAEAGSIRNLKGFGAKTEQKLLEAISSSRTKPKARLHLHHALNTAERVVEYLKNINGIDQISFAGSLRRWEETVGNIDIVVSSKDPQALLSRFLQFPMIVSHRSIDSNCNVELADGASVSLTVVTPKEFAATLFIQTGSAAHLEKLGKVTDLQRISSGRLPQTELDIYRRLEMQYIPPELREDHGEVEAARARKLSEDLLS